MSTKAPSSSRLPFIDALRGLGVVLMVQLHTSHGWMHPVARSGFVWQAAQFFGGLAAPIFLTLAGVSLGLRWASDDARGRAPRLAEDLRRALQLVVLGYTLRLQMWFIDAGGYARFDALHAQLLLLAAYALAYFALSGREWTQNLRPMAAALCGSVAMFSLALVLVAHHAPERLPGLLRVDVLQCIGGSLALAIGAAAIQGRRFARGWTYVVLGAAAAFLASWTRSWVPGPLPPPIAGYLGQWPAEPGKSVIGLFPLFPWVAYALLGCALGLAWGRTLPERLTRRVLWLALASLIVALATTESGQAAYALLKTAPWLTQPVRVANRLAWVLVLAGGSVALCRRFAEAAAPFEAFGRCSLLVYWVHLEFAFGAASSPLSKSLGPGGWALGTLALIAAMWLLAWIRLNYSRLRLGTARAAEH